MAAIKAVMSSINYLQVCCRAEIVISLSDF